MKKLTEDLDNFGMPKEEFLFEMANVRKDTTGLPVNIWVSPKPSHLKKHLRIKVSNLYSNSVDPDQSFTLINEEPNIKIIGETGEISKKDISIVIDFFVKYKEIFLKLWNKEIDDDSFKRMIRTAVKKSQNKT